MNTIFGWSYLIHHGLNSLFNVIPGSSISGGLPGVYRAFNGNMDITGYMIHAAYAQLLNVIDSEERMINWWESQDVEYRTDDMIHLDDLKTMVFNGLRNMGLLSLT